MDPPTSTEIRSYTLRATDRASAASSVDRLPDTPGYRNRQAHASPAAAGSSGMEQTPFPENRSRQRAAQVAGPGKLTLSPHEDVAGGPEPP